MRRQAAAIPMIALSAHVACAPTSRAPQAPTTVSIPAPSAAPVAPVAPDAPSIERLAAARRAYVEGGDPRALIAMWGDDLRVRAGRARSPSPYDSVFGRRRLETIYEWATSHQSRVTLRIAAPALRAQGELAIIEWFAVESIGDGAPSAFGEQYRLERRRGEWTVVGFDYWPVDPDTFHELGAYFEKADQEVEDARARGDERTLAYRLMAAYRFDECARVSRRLTDAAPDDAWAWEMRGKASALVGDRADADRSMEEAERLTGKR